MPKSTKAPGQTRHALRALAKTIEVLPTPDKKKAIYNPSTKGNTEGTAELGVCRYAAQLFQLNELFGEPGLYRAKEKMSDAEIERQLRAKYPNARLVRRFDLPASPMTVNQLRQHYNSGRLVTRLMTNAPISFRYNATGQIVDGRTGRRALTPAEIEKQKAHWEQSRHRNRIRRETASEQAIEWWYGDQHGISDISYRRRRAAKRVLDSIESQAT